MDKDGRLLASLRRLQRVKQVALHQVTNDEGQGLAEYAFILLLVAVACVAALGTLADGVIGGITAGANMFP